MPEDLSGLIKNVVKDLGGAAVISNLDEIVTPFDTKLPTGILGLDMALRGGIPAGAITQLFGPDGAGKNYLASRVIAEQQAIHGDSCNICLVSFGYKFDRSLMRLAGVRLKKSNDELIREGIDPSEATPEQRGETTGNIIFIDTDEEKSLSNPAETQLTAVLKLIRSNRFHLMVIDELGSGETKYNVVKDLHEDAKIATWAALLSDFCRKYYSAMRIPDDNGNPNMTSMIMINPVRANLDARSSRYVPHVQGGGYALKHAKAVDIHLRGGSSITTVKEGKLGKQVKWKISKGKHGISEGAEGQFDFYFNRGVDLLQDLANMGKVHGAIRNSGPIYYILDYEDKIKGGLAGVVEVLRNNPDIASEVRKAVLELDNG